MTSARQKKKMATKDRTDNKKFIYYVVGIVVVLLVLMYMAFRSYSACGRITFFFLYSIVRREGHSTPFPTRDRSGPWLPEKRAAR